MKKSNVWDIFYIIVISIPASVYIVPWILDPNPSLGIDSYGGGSLLMNKTLEEVIRGYFTDWYLGANFVLFPVKFVYWAVLKGLSFISSNPFTIIKLSYAFTLFLSVITSYMVIKKLYKNRLYGVLGSLLYVYAPYHMSWNGIEAVWSLSLFYAILPLAFYYFSEFVIELNTENRTNNIKLLLSSLSLSLIMFTYPQSFFLLTIPFFIVFSILFAITKIESREKFVLTIKPIILSFLPIIIALLIGSIWWIPALTQKNILVESTNTIDAVTEKTPPLLSIITLQGRSFTIPSFQYFFHSNIEIVLTLALAIIIWMSILCAIKEAFQKKIYWIISTIISSVLFIFLTMGPLSPIPLYTWLYDNIPFFSNMRAPDRWLSIIILGISLVFPFGIDILSRNWVKKLPKIKFIGFCAITILILANSTTELNYAFKDFQLNTDIYQHYEFLSSQQNGSRILPVPFYQNTYKLEKNGNNIETDRDPFIVDPRLWNFMYGEKENFLGGSESLSVKEMGNFITLLNDYAKEYSVNLNLIDDIYGIDYLWIDKTKETKDKRLFYDTDNSITKSVETENYILYKNNDPYPRIFYLGEDTTEFNDGWDIKEGNGDMKLLSSSNNSLKLQINFFDKSVREWRYAEDNESIDVGMLDEIYGEYNVSGIDPKLVELHLKFEDENGRHYKWIIKFETSNKPFRIPVFWFQPQNKKGTELDAKTIKHLEIGILESPSDIKSKKEFVVELKNLTILKHQLFNVSYQKIDNLQYSVILPEVNNYSKGVLVFNYAYNPDIKLVLNNTLIDSYKIFGFLNAFEIPYNGKEKMIGTIEYKTGKPFYYGMIISLVTVIGIMISMLYNMARNRLKIR